MAIYRFAAAALALAAFVGPAQAETRSVSGFAAVAAADRLSVEVVVGDAYSVEVSGADADRVRTRVEGRTLRIEDSRRPWFGNLPRLDARVRVTAPALSAVSAARGAELSAQLAGGCADFSASAAMGASANVAGVACDRVEVDAAMGGEVQIAGACRDLDVSASMGGFVRAEALACARVDASASMGGDIRAYASEAYDASASMGGAIVMSGEGRSRGSSALMGGYIRASH